MNLLERDLDTKSFYLFVENLSTVASGPFKKDVVQIGG